jgi:hypothetical protein
MQSMQKTLGFGNIGQTEVAFGKIAIIVIIAVLTQVYMAEGQTYCINCYDTSISSSGYYFAKTKFINLGSREITDEVIIANEGELINTKPVELVLGNDTLLISSIVDGCFCKNTSVGSYNTKFTIVNKSTRRIVRQWGQENQLVVGFESGIANEIYITGSNIVGGHETYIDGIYNLTNRHILVRSRQVPAGYTPNSITDVGPFTYPRLIANNLYYDTYNRDYYVIKVNLTHTALLDTIHCFNFESRNQIFGVKDSLLYVFSLNYERHMNGEGNKEYGQGWIQSNVLIFRIADFARLDSIPIPDYPRGEYISGITGTADTRGRFIVYYFGDANNMEELYPAMLFIFDTRTNQATWLRVGWR